MVPLSRELLAEISGAPEKRLTDELVKCLNRTMIAYGINTVRRQAHFLAQIIHESGAFRYTKEIASGDAYEGRVDLGNTEPGDGRKFVGRAYIQLTGRHNYTSYSLETGVDFVAEPEKLSELPYACTSAGWFWKTRGLNELADEGDVRSVTRRVNGGYNGLAERIACYEKAERALTSHREKIMRYRGRVRPADLVPVSPLPTHLPSVPNHLSGGEVLPVLSTDQKPKKSKWIGVSRVTMGVLIMALGAFGVKIPHSGEILANWETIFVSITTIVGGFTAIYGRMKATQRTTLLPSRQNDDPKPLSPPSTPSS